MARHQLRLVNGEIQAIYAPDLVALLRQAGCKPQFARFSHVDPTPDGDGFMIVWLDAAIKSRLRPGDFVWLYGRPVTLAEEGCGFPTKEEAEEREVWLLRHRLFMEELRDVSASTTL